jgi:hypothetical protein
MARRRYRRCRFYWLPPSRRTDPVWTPRSRRDNLDPLVHSTGRPPADVLLAIENNSIKPLALHPANLSME